MIPVKCEICSKDAEALFIVSHKERGRIRICEDCLKKKCTISFLKRAAIAVK